MDLLESVLRTANAETFTEKFKSNGIDTTSLSLLNDEDLQLLGIEDANVRQDILKRIENLHYITEKRNSLLIDEDYVLTALHCMSHQLLLHYAGLSYAMHMTDTVLCDVKLSPATQCLVSCVEDLHVKVNRLEQLVCPEKKKSNKKYYALIVVPICLYFAVNFVKSKW